MFGQMSRPPLGKIHAPRPSPYFHARLRVDSRRRLALAKDSVTIGMALEPPGLDPTSAPAAAIGEIVQYNVFEGLTKIDEDFSFAPLLAEKWTFSPDLKSLTFALNRTSNSRTARPSLRRT